MRAGCIPPTPTSLPLFHRPHDYRATDARMHLHAIRWASFLASRVSRGYELRAHDWCVRTRRRGASVCACVLASVTRRRFLWRRTTERIPGVHVAALPPSLAHARCHVARPVSELDRCPPSSHSATCVGACAPGRAAFPCGPAGARAAGSSVQSHLLQGVAPQPARDISRPLLGRVAFGTRRAAPVPPIVRGRSRPCDRSQCAHGS